MSRTLRTLLITAALGTLVLTGCSGGDAAGGAQADAPESLFLAQSQTSTGTTLARGVTVSGTGRVTGAPDTLRVTVGVEVVRESVQAAMDAANEAAERVLATVREQGVEDRDIRTTSFSVHPQYDHRPEATQPTITGYVVSNLVEIAIRDLDRAGEVLAAATEAGGDAARVQRVQFALEDNEVMLADARERAFADARAKAEQYAELTGRSLGELASISEVVGSDPPAPVPYGGEAAARDSAVPIEPGQQEVSVQVTAVWSFE